MRSQAQIRRQLKQVTFRHLKRQLRALFKQRPDTCQHNRDVALDEDTHVQLCGVLDGQGRPRNVPCDSRIPGCNEMARECPLWHPLRTKAEVKAAFHGVVQSDDRGVVASEYPDIAALMWVLDDPADTPSVAEVEEDLGDEEPEPVQSWTRKWIRKLGGGA